MAETTTTTGTAPAAGGEGQTPQQTNQQPTTPTAEQRTAFQKFWDSLFGGKEEPAPGSGEGTKKDGDPAPKESFSGITFPAMAICTSFPVREEINGTLTMNNWYAFDGAAAFDGSRKFNAQIMQEEF